jgi:NADP-dependent 3-hydroxy acid dehydrogenase YdfG
MNTIFITGAGAGIGRATARLFAGKGWFVGASDRDAMALESLQQELGKKRCSVHVLDVLDVSSVQKALAEFTSLTGGSLQVLHNNAGILKVGAFERIALADHRRVIEVNVIGLLNVLHSAFPYLRDTPGAQVINMSSASAVFGTPDFVSYSGSKHAVRAITEGLSIEWEPHGIRVCDLMPPFVNTGMVQDNQENSRLIARLGANLTPDAVAQEVWRLVRKPLLHRPITLPLRLVWPLTRSLPVAMTRGILKQLWKE